MTTNAKNNSEFLNNLAFKKVDHQPQRADYQSNQPGNSMPFGDARGNYQRNIGFDTGRFKDSKVYIVGGGIGVAGPAIIAGVLLLLNKFAMALFVSLGPIFIMCLLFDQTKALFHKWLYFGIATTFTTIMLAVMSSIAMKMVGALAASVIAADFLGANTSGFTQVAMQQGGLGLILSTLLITVPPMAGNFFSNALGNYSYTSAFGQLGGNGNLGGRGADGRNGGTVVQSGGASQSTAVENHANRTLPSSMTSFANPQMDTIKSHSMMGNAMASTQPMLQAHSVGASFNTDSIKSMGDDSIAMKQKHNNLLITPQKVEV